MSVKEVKGRQKEVLRGKSRIGVGVSESRFGHWPGGGGKGGCSSFQEGEGEVAEVGFLGKFHHLDLEELVFHLDLEEEKQLDFR